MGNEILRILVVDEDAATAQLIRQRLDAMQIGSTVEAASSSPEAFSGIERKNYDVLLVDHRLAKDLLGEMRTRGVKTPVFVIPSQCDDQTVASALRAGAAGCISLSELSRESHSNALWHVMELQRKEKLLSETEEAMRSSQKFNRTLLDSLPQGVCFKDQNSVLLTVNARFAEFLGTTPEALVGQTDHDLFPGERAGKHRADDLRVMTSGKPETFEEVFLEKGEERTFEITHIPVMRSDGSAGGVLGIMTDITVQKRAEQSLRQSQHWFQTVLEASRDGIVVELDEIIVYANTSFASLFGYDSLQELIGQHISLLQSDEDKERMLEMGRRRGRGEAVQAAYAFKGRRKDGVSVELEASVSTTSIGDKLYIVSLARDISERRQAERKIQSTLSLLSATLESTADGILVVDRAGKITSFNRKFLQMWRIPVSVAESLDDTTTLEYVLTQLKDPKRFLSKVIEVYNRPDVESHDLVEFNDGRVFERYSQPQRIGAEVVGRVWSFRDITVRRGAEEALRASEERYRLLFENNPQPMFVYDSETLAFLAVSDALIQEYGYSRDEFLSMTISDIRPPEDASSLVDTISANAGDFEPSRRERHRKKDGTVIEVEISASDFKVGDRRGQLVLATDITERRHLEEQLRLAQKMEGIGRLAGGIAHDFNNLLTTVLGYSDLLLEEVDKGDRLHSDILEIKKAGERAAALTRQLLAFSRRQVLQPTVLDMNSVVSDLDRMLRRLIGEDIELLSARDDTLGRVKADAGQIEQVIVNLVVNARDAMPSGGKITIETSNVDLDETYARQHIAVVTGRYVMLAVSDTGCGMDEETKAQIFEPFFTTKDRSKGTGLGLSTVYGIVKQSGGNIWVYTEPGLGTTFKVYLPRVDDPIRIPEPPAVQPKAVGGSETILLVEDEDSVRSLAREILQRNGYAVLEATHGSEALVICKQHQGLISLMLTDVVMPGMSGREVAEKLSTVRPEMKVIFMSGYSDHAIVQHGILEPGTRFLPKPYTPDTLIRKVRDVLDEKAPESRA